MQRWIWKGLRVEQIRPSLMRKLRENGREGIIFLSFLLLFFLTLLGIRGLKIGNAHNPGAGFMPFWSGILLLLLAAVNFWRSFTRGAKDAHQVIKPSFKTIFVLAGILAYTVIAPYLGFSITIFFLLVLFFSLIERKNFPLIIIISGVTTILTYLVFVMLMKCQFPRGILGIG